jgi:hypothetical protein
MMGKKKTAKKGMSMMRGGGMAKKKKRVKKAGGGMIKKIEVKTINIPGFGSYTGPIKILPSKLGSGKQKTKSTKSPAPVSRLRKGGMARKKK